MTKPIPDQAEVAVESPGKNYICKFERSSRFDAHCDESGVAITFCHDGDTKTRKSVRMHIHYGLFAKMLSAVAKTASSFPSDYPHTKAVRDGADALCRSLDARLPTLKSASEKRGHHGVRPGDNKSGGNMTLEEEEVLLLHIME